MAQLRINIPGPDAPGYLRRMRAFARINAKREANDLTFFDDLIAVLVDFVEADDGVDVEAAIENLSENEFESLMAEFVNSGKSQPASVES